MQHTCHEVLMQHICHEVLVQPICHKGVCSTHAIRVHHRCHKGVCSMCLSITDRQTNISTSLSQAQLHYGYISTEFWEVQPKNNKSDCLIYVHSSYSTIVMVLKTRQASKTGNKKKDKILFHRICLSDYRWHDYIASWLVKYIWHSCLYKARNAIGHCLSVHPLSILNTLKANPSRTNC